VRLQKTKRFKYHSIVITKMEIPTKESIKLFGGLASIVLAHGACIALGAYKGSMHARHIEVDIPFRYLWASNIAGSAFGNALSNYPSSDCASTKAVKGAVAGTIAAPLEFMFGYGVGYVGGYISDKVFS
jgi:hypothetical protein